MHVVVRAANAVFALLMLVVVAATAAALLLDPNDYKGHLVDAVQDATGRRLTLGDLRLTRSLWPMVSATDVSLANLPGGSRPYLAHAERVEGRLSLLALLRRRIDIADLTLVGPNILFEQVDGRPNWVFEGASGAAAPAQAAKPGSGFELRIRDAHVRNGMVTWKLPARTKVVGIRALDFRRPRENGVIEADSTLVYSDNEPFALDIRAEPTGSVMDPWRTRLHFAAFDTDATADGTMDVAGQYDLAVNATAGSLERLNALLPEMRLPMVRQARLSARIGNGRQPGDLPVLGATTLRFASADLRDWLAGLVLGPTTATLPAAGGQATVDGDGRYREFGVHLSGTVGVPVRPDGKATLPVDLTLAAIPAVKGSLTLKGRLTLDTLRFAGLEAAATGRAERLAALRPVLGTGLPALTAVRLDAQATVPPGAGPIRLRGVSLATDQGDVTGDGGVDLDTAPKVTGHWRSNALDLDAMLAAFGIDLSRPAAARATGPVIPDTPLPWDALRGPALNLDAAVGAMRFQGEVWRDVQFALALKDGKLHLSPLSLLPPGGTSRLQAGLAADSGTVSLSLSAPALPLALLGRHAGLPGPVTGAATVSAELRGRGRTVRDLAGTLQGPFSVTAAGGRLGNAALIGVASAALEALGIKVPQQGETALNCLELAGSFSGGVGTITTLVLGTTYLSLDGSGQVDLGRETVALRLEPMARVAGSPVSVPVVVTGPFRNVSARLDATGVEKLGFLIDGLFGGDSPAVCAKAGRGR